eukprot:2017385-Lingulodinium_polyedra.AAC.1
MSPPWRQSSSSCWGTALHVMRSGTAACAAAGSSTSRRRRTRTRMAMVRALVAPRRIPARRRSPPESVPHCLGRRGSGGASPRGT